MWRLILVVFSFHIVLNQKLNFDEKLQPLLHGSPNLFKKLGTIYITYGFVHLRTTIKIGRYVEDCDKLKQKLNVIRDKMKIALDTEYLNHHPTFRQIYQFSEEKIDRVASVCDKLVHTNLIFSNEKNNRDKRAVSFVGSAIGSMIATITGIFTTTEVLKLEKKFNDVRSDVEEIDNILRAVNSRISDLEKKFDNITDQAIEITEFIKMAQKTSIIYAYNLKLDLLFGQLQTISQMVCDTVQDILQGHLPVHLMEGEDLEKIFYKLKKIAEKNNLEIPMTKPFELYNMPTTYILRDGIQAFSHIPVFSRKTSLELNSYTAMPIRDARIGNYFEVHSKNKLIAITHDQLQMQELNYDTLEDCIHFDKIYLCQDLTIVESSPKMNCIGSVYINYEPGIAEFCDILIYKSLSTVRKLNGNRYLIATTDMDTIAISCAEGVTYRKKIQGIYKLDLPYPCIAKFRKYLIYSQFQEDQNESVNLMDLHINWSQQLLEFENSQIKDAIKALTNLKTTTDGVTVKNYLHQHKKQKSKMSLVFYSIIAVTVVGIIICIITLLYVSYKKYRMSQTLKKYRILWKKGNWQQPEDRVTICPPMSSNKSNDLQRRHSLQFTEKAKSPEESNILANKIKVINQELPLQHVSLPEKEENYYKYLAENVFKSV